MPTMLFDETRVRGILDNAVDAGVLPGCAFGAVDRHGRRQCVCVGRHRSGTREPAVTETSVYDVASVTKVLPTSTLALMLLEEGRLALDMPVRRFLPELAHAHADRVTVHHLLTHTLDFGFRFSSLKDKSPDEILHELYTCELRSPPGETFFYANATSILLGLVVERVLGTGLADAARERIFEPLQLRETSFGADQVPSERVVPTEHDPWRGREVCGEVHDESAWTLSKAMTPGSAGVFSTLTDLLTFMQTMLGDAAGGGALLSAQTLADVATNQIPHLGVCTGLGWELNQSRYMGDAAPAVVGKTGFTGCVVMADLKAGRALVMLSNFTWPVRKPGRGGIDAIRRTLADCVFCPSA